MKKQILLSVFILFVSCGFSQQKATFRQGEKTVSSFAISDMKKITFTFDGINIFTADGNCIFISFSSINNIIFSDADLIIDTDGEPVNIDGEELSVKTKIWYSPSVEKVFIKSPTALGDISVYDIRGRLVGSAKPQGYQRQNAEVSLSAFPSGLYIIISKNGDGLITGKIIK